MKRYILFLVFNFAIAGFAKASTQTRIDYLTSQLTGHGPTRTIKSYRQSSPFKAYLNLKENPSHTNKASYGKRLCIDNVTITFNSPINIATLLGKVYSVTHYHSKKPLHIESHSSDFRTFVFKLPTADVCPRLQFYENLVVSDDIYNVAGKKLSREVKFKLKSANGQRAYFSTKSNTMFPKKVTFQERSSRQVLLKSISPNFHWSSTQSPCVGRSFEPCLRVKASDLNRAFKAVREWTAREKRNSWYSTNLTLIPLENTILTPYSEQQRHHQYGHPDVIFLLRRAAKFVSVLFPDLRAIPVADLSNRLGQTPFASMGDKKIYLHPKGSHSSGKDADVSYITKGSGHEEDEEYDFEKNFWFLYSILQSSGVDLVITAYKTEMKEIGTKAYQSGLITDISLGRFNMLMEDMNLNHDKHLHLSVKNADNQYKTRRFHSSDNVYTCYLALSPRRRGGNLNFCK